MDLGLAGKTALVTGASQGIGREIARALHAEGVGVVLVARSAEKLARIAREIVTQTGRSDVPLHPIAADVGLLAEVERVCQQAVQRLGHVDLLINNAASTRTANFFEMSDADVAEAWQVKGMGYLRFVRALAPAMMQRRSGCIVNIIGSTARTPAADFLAGSMVNAALVNFTRGMARELARSNVYMHAISPGWTLTERQEQSFQMRAAAQGVTPEQIERQEARAIPLSRLVSAKEIARLTLLLASGQLPSLTGEDILVDGGACPSV